MRFTKIALSLGVGAMMLTCQALAADQGHGSVKFTGSIISAPCTVTPETIDQTVEMGQISNKALDNGGKSRARPFNIILEDCVLTDLSDKTVGITFTGPESTTLPGYLAMVGDASGAAIGITNSDGKNIALGTSSSIKVQNGDNILSFAAYLQGNSSIAVVPGTFNSVANFTLSYK